MRRETLEEAKRGTYVFVNGRTAERYYQKYTEPVIQRTAICLPSTSPANAAWKPDDLVREWRVIREA